MHSKDLLRKLNDAPFKPFRLRMANNTVYDIVDPGMIIVGDTSAVVATQNVRGRPWAYRHNGLANHFDSSHHRIR